MQNIKVFKTLPSTSQYLKNELSQGVSFKDFFAVVALAQSGGVGKRSKAWFSPEGNLYISFIVSSTVVKEQDINLNLAEVVFKSVVATGKTLDFLMPNNREKLQYKWPNDVVYDGKKIAGILIEKIETSYIIGIGINLNVSPQIKDYATIAVCDIIEDGICVLHVAECLRDKLREVFGLGFQEVRESFLAKAYKFHETIKVSVNNQLLEGKFVDIDSKSGAMVLLMGDNLMEHVHYGEIF